MLLFLIEVAISSFLFQHGGRGTNLQGCRSPQHDRAGVRLDRDGAGPHVPLRSRGGPGIAARGGGGRERTHQ